jgi:outer membrane lipoprotein-sorting protein
MIRFAALLLVFSAAFTISCGPVPPPRDAYTKAPDILADLADRRKKIKSFRITGRVDHFGEEHRVQGKTYFFSVLPKKLRIELVSPFGSPLNVLTINDDVFALHDLREGRYLTGPAKPCNIARLVKIPMPRDDVVRILVGYTPLIEGASTVSWDDKGFYRVTLKDGERTQHLEIDGNHQTLPLMRSWLEDKEGVVFDITFKKWQSVASITMPHEIHVAMPKEKTDLLVRYDKGGVELNVELPDDAWDQSPPRHLKPETVDCE